MRHIAPNTAKVNLTRPRVLNALPLSCGLVFGAFVALSDETGELQVPLRELSGYTGLSHTQIRRALKRLCAVRLLEPLETGHGRVASAYRLRWRSFPQPFGTSLKKLSERENLKSSLSVASDDGQSKNSPLKGENPLKDPPLRDPLSHPVSEKGRRWFLGELRRFLRDDCRLPPDRYTELLLAFARALRLSLKAGRIRTGRELGRVYRFVRERLDTDPRYLASKLAKLEGGTRYGAVMRLFGDALRDLEHERKREQLNTEQLKRIREEKERARREWQASEQTSELDFSDTNALKRASPEFVDGFITRLSRWQANRIPPQLARETLLKIRLLLGFAPLSKTQRRALKRLHETFFDRAQLPKLLTQV